MHPQNPSSTPPNQSRSAKPAGTITSSPSPADFRTPPPPPSNLHSARQPSSPTSRAFLHWRLSDDGPGASRIVPIGRHPKPFTEPDLSETAANLRKARTSRDFRCSDRQRISARSLFQRRRSLSTGPGIPPDYLSYQPTRSASAMAYLRASRSMSRQAALAFARSWSVERASSRK